MYTGSTISVDVKFVNNILKMIDHHIQRVSFIIPIRTTSQEIQLLFIRDAKNTTTKNWLRLSPNGCKSVSHGSCFDDFIKERLLKRLSVESISVRSKSEMEEIVMFFLIGLCFRQGYKIS